MVKTCCQFENPRFLLIFGNLSCLLVPWFIWSLWRPPNSLRGDEQPRWGIFLDLIDKVYYTQGYLRDRRLCQWAQKVKPSWLPNFQFNNRTFRLVWQKSSLKMEWRVMLRLHFNFYKHFCISNQEKVTGPSSGIFSLALSGWRPVTGHQSLFEVLLKRLARTHKYPHGLLETPQVLCGLVEVPQSLVGPCEFF